MVSLTASSTAGSAGWANGTLWWCWAISALCGMAARRNRKSSTGCASAPTPCFSLMVPTRITTCWPSTPSRSGLAAGSRLWAAMCIMSAVAVCWSWRERNISASAAPRAPTRKSGRPDTTGGRRRCPAMRNTPPVRPISKQTAGR